MATSASKQALARCKKRAEARNKASAAIVISLSKPVWDLITDCD
jgi:hypothetical protein